ncbi:MAG: hypothetical protein QW590_00305 [Candidatus Bilamarchaeaceae archaeon]
MKLKQKRIWEFEGKTEDGEGRAEWEEDGIYYSWGDEDAELQESESV